VGVLYTISLTLYLLMLIFVLFSIGKVKSVKNLIRKLGYKKITKRDIFLSISFFGFLIITAVIISSLFVYGGYEEDVEKVSSTLKEIDFFSVLLVLIVGSIVEEIFFRGYLQRKTNIWIATFIFAYFHIVYGSLSEIVGAFFLGLILGYAYNRTKNLFVPTFSHLAYNILIVYLIFWVG